MTQIKLEKTIFINAKLETVWEYLTDCEKLGQWFHPASANLANGKDYALLNDKGERMCWGRVTEAKPPNKLVYTFTHKWMNEVDTTVIWELSDVHGGTRVKLTHFGFEDTGKDPLELLINHDKGWDDHFGRLREKAAQ